MKSPRFLLLVLAVLGTYPACGQGSVTTSTTVSTANQYTNFIRQIQSPSGVQWDASVVAAGTQNAALPVDTTGANFQLWTVMGGAAPVSHLLDSKFVAAFSPVATINIRTEEPYALVPRTRCDRPFWVDVTVSGLVPGNTNVTASGRSVDLLRHVQSYGTVGTDAGINRSQATLLSKASIDSNGLRSLTYSITAVPGANLASIAGEERFSVFTVLDGNFPVAQLASSYVQIWPLASGKISGIKNNDVIRFDMPRLTISLKTLYPTSDTYVQVYRGPSVLGTVGRRLTTVLKNHEAPQDDLLQVSDYGQFIDRDGQWTMEVLTNTPFGTDRLDTVTFTVNRTLNVNTMLTTSD